MAWYQFINYIILYTDFSWLSSKAIRNVDTHFFDTMNEMLNDDCIRKIIEYVDIPHLMYFSHIDERFEDIVRAESSRDLRIFPSTVGSIGLMNFRYLLEFVGSSLKSISLSLMSFPSSLGFYYSNTKMYYTLFMNVLKLNDFDFDYTEDVKNILQLFSQRGIKVIIF